MNKFYLIIVSTLFLAHCKQEEQKDSIYFGGEILNPKSKYVLLMQNEKVIDTLPLDKNNNFGKKFENLKPGLYFFSHGNEFQYVYFDVNDSIRLRLNTWDFDESLVFDGKGADKNDFLLNRFLNNEKELHNFYTYFSLPESDFNTKFDTVFKANAEFLNNYLSTSHSSNAFKRLAKGSTIYPLYRLKELYPYYHLKLNPNDSTFQVSDQFYDYRKKLNINDAVLSEYYGYQNYVSSYLYNEVFKSSNYKNDNTFRDKLFGLIVTKIENQNLKNKFLYNETLNCLFKSDDEINSKSLDLFYKHCNDSAVVIKIKNIMLLKEQLPEGKKFPNIQLSDTNGQITNTAKELTNRHTLIYFWKPNSNANEFVKNRVGYLRKKYPNVQFVGISSQRNELTYFGSIFDKQFYISDQKNNLMDEDFARVVLVDKQGKVFKNFLNINESKIESDLNQLVGR